MPIFSVMGGYSYGRKYNQLYAQLYAQPYFLQRNGHKHSPTPPYQNAPFRPPRGTAFNGILNTH